MADRSDQIEILIGPDMNREKKRSIDCSRSRLINLVFQDIYKLHSISYILLNIIYDCLSYGPIIQKSQKRPFQKLYENLVFEVLFFFLKNQP